MREPLDDKHGQRLAELGAYYGIPALPALFGVGFAMCWCYSSQRLTANIVDGWFQIAQYCGMTVAALALALLGTVRGRNLTQSRPAAIACLALCAVIAPLIVVEGPWTGNVPVMLTLAAVDGATFVWLLLEWGAFYAGLNLRQAFACVCGFLVLSSAVKIFFDLLGHDAVGAILLAALPVASTWCLRMARDSRVTAPETETPTDRPFKQGNLHVLAPVAAAVAIVVTGVALCMSVTLGVFGLPFAFRVVSQVATICISVGAAIIAARAWDVISPFKLWYIVVAVIATGLAGGIIVGAPLGALSSAIFTTAQMFSIGFVWLALSDVARRGTIPSDTVFGMGWGLLFSTPMAVGLALPHALAGDVDVPSLAVVVLWLLLLALAFMEQRQSPELRLFVDFSPQVPPEKTDTLADALDALAARYDLTAREREVVALYAQGRNRAFISAQLFISENTVRDHIKSAYRKLGIHNKQELIDLVG